MHEGPVAGGVYACVCVRGLFEVQIVRGRYKMHSEAYGRYWGAKVNSS